MFLKTIAFKLGFWNAWLFMSVFLLQMLAVICAGERILKRSHVPLAARKNRGERRAGLAGNIFWFFALVYSVFLPLQLGTVWFRIGVGVFLIGLFLMIIATVNFIQAGEGMISRGAYRYSRHPMYFATFTIYLGTAIATVSWLFLLITVASAYCFLTEAHIEERHCREVFGSSYEKYLKRTPRWIGLPRRRAENQ